MVQWPVGAFFLPWLPICNRRITEWFGGKWPRAAKGTRGRRPRDPYFTGERRQGACDPSAIVSRPWMGTHLRNSELGAVQNRLAGRRQVSYRSALTLDRSRNRS